MPFKKGQPGYWKGKNLSLQTRKKISESRKGIKLSEEHKKKISAHFKGRFVGEKNPMWNGGCRRYYQNIAYKVWEDYWNEKMPSGYILHHVDQNPKNNLISNLAMITVSLHEKIHKKNTNRCPVTGRFTYAEAT